MITEKLTKSDAARRQTDEAIRMFFDRRDTVAPHTVAAAAAQVLADVGEHHGFQGWTRNKAIVKPEHWKRWRDCVTKYERFFKHADNPRVDTNAHATCSFHPEATQLILVEFSAEDGGGEWEHLPAAGGVGHNGGLRNSPHTAPRFVGRRERVGHPWSP